MNISLIKWAIDFIIKAIEKKYDLKKIKDYVDKPNELDRKVQELENNVIIFNKCFDNVEGSIIKIQSVWLNDVKIPRMIGKPIIDDEDTGEYT